MTSSDWTESIEGFLAAQRAAGAPETTITTRRSHLRYVARCLGGSPWTVTGDELVAWTSTRDWARETRRSYRSTLRKFYAWGLERGRVEASPAEVLGPIKPAVPLARPTPDQIYDAALRRADARTRLILRLAAEMGLRRGEIAQIHSRDLVEDLEGWSLIVHGKGERQRIVPLTPSVERELRARFPGFAFPGDDAGHLSPRWVGKLATRVLDGTWTLHTLRHRFASRAYAVDRDVFAVQELLGHASPATTRRYVAVHDSRLRRTVLAAA